MKRFEFSLVVEGFDPLNGEHMTNLFRVLPEVTASGWQGQTLMEFSLPGTNALSALRKARKDVEKSIPGARVISLAEDLVGVPDIASRSGRSEESIRQLVNGLRGPGNFPMARGVLRGGTKIWRWPDVAPWLVENGVLDSSGDEFVDQASDTIFELELIDQSAGTSAATRFTIEGRPPTPAVRPRRTAKAGATGSKWRIDIGKHVTTKGVVAKKAAASRSAVSKKPRVKDADRLTAKGTRER
jgi:hypothetical protein